MALLPAAATAGSEDAPAWDRPVIKTDLVMDGLGIFALEWVGRVPPAALVRFAGQSLEDRAYLIGCGHCNRMPVGSYVVDRPVEGKKAYLRRKNSERTFTLDVTRIVYGTQTSVDLILVEVAQTYREIEALYGVKARLLSAETQALATPIWFYNWETVEACQIDAYADRYVFNDEGTDYLANAYIYYDCISTGGYSGSVLISKATQEVIGINVGGSEEPRDGHIINFGSTVAPLSKCLDAHSRFDIHAPHCKLRIGE